MKDAQTLADRLSLGRGIKLWLHRVPDSLRDRLRIEDNAIDELAAPSQGIEAAIICASDADTAHDALASVDTLLAPAGFVWLLLPDTVSDDRGIATLAAERGLSIDGVCAIDGEWVATRLIHRG